MMLLDKRIGAIELHPYLRTPHEVCELEFGDIAITGIWGNKEVTVGVERKRVNDLLKSIESGRLVGHQLPGMLDTYDRSYLLVEGLWRPDEGRRLCTYRGKKFKPVQFGSRRYGTKDVHAFLLSVGELFGVRLIQTGSEQHSAAWLDDMHYWWNKKTHRTALVLAAEPTTMPVEFNRKPPTVALVASRLRGVGGRKALDIAKKYRTVEDLVGAGVEGLMEVEGIGKTIAEGIWKQLRER